MWTFEPFAQGAPCSGLWLNITLQVLGHVPCAGGAEAVGSARSIAFEAEGRVFLKGSWTPAPAGSS